jgi:hypothetical protein
MQTIPQSDIILWKRDKHMQSRRGTLEFYEYNFVFELEDKVFDFGAYPLNTCKDKFSFYKQRIACHPSINLFFHHPVLQLLYILKSLILLFALKPHF